MRVLLVAGYDHAAYHRKVELLADAPDVELLHVTVAGYGREGGWYPSADGRRRYRVQTFEARWLGGPADGHRACLWPPHFGLNRFRPDIVQYESDLETLGSAELVLARAALARQARLIGYTWQNILRRRRLAVRWLVHMNLRAADHMICSSTEAVTVIRRQGYLRGASVMPLVGVDRRLFNPRPSRQVRESLGLDCLVVGYVGRLIPEKGLDVLLRAFQQLPQAGHLLIVGDGSERATLMALAESLGIGSRCRFQTGVAYDLVPDYMNAMDVLVLPSRTTPHWKEQFGRVLVEAMACQVAVVGSDSGAIPEVIGCPECVFPEGDSVALASILRRLADDSLARAAIACRGCQRVQNEYTTERLAQRLLALWRRMGPSVCSEAMDGSQ
jgi:glycosyltransferase involved in cell wall biosynthesis